MFKKFDFLNSVSFMSTVSDLEDGGVAATLFYLFLIIFISLEIIFLFDNF